MMTTNANVGYDDGAENSSKSPSITRMIRCPATVLANSRTESDKGLKNSPMMSTDEEDVEGPAIDLGTPGGVMNSLM